MRGTALIVIDMYQLENARRVVHKLKAAQQSQCAGLDTHDPPKYLTAQVSTRHS
jgi:hypothetical protein